MSSKEQVRCPQVDRSFSVVGGVGVDAVGAVQRALRVLLRLCVLFLPPNRRASKLQMAHLACVLRDSVPDAPPGTAGGTLCAASNTAPAPSPSPPSNTQLFSTPGVCRSPDAETKGFVFQQTMLRVKDPKASLDFYTRVLGALLRWILADAPQVFVGRCSLSVASSNALNTQTQNKHTNKIISTTHNTPKRHDAHRQARFPGDGVHAALLELLRPG